MGLLSGIGNAIGGLLNSLTGVSSQMNQSFAQGIAANNLSYAQQKEAMAIQNSYNRAMWDLSNEYNTPTAQLARMRDAGVDVNPTAYALGSGNLSNTATSVSSAGGFSGDFSHGSGSPAGNPISMALGVANGIAGIKNTNASTENLEAQRKNTDALSRYTKQHARQMKNDNDFFERYGYYPTHADTPVGSGIETGLGADILGALARGKQKYEERIKNNT